MPGRNTLVQVIGPALAVGLLVACASAEPTHAPAPVAATVWDPTIPRTEVIRFVPEVPTEVRDGFCMANSFSVRRADAWRCTVDDQVLDPCYTGTDGETIVCGVFPGASNLGFQLRLSAPLPAPDVSPHAPASAFMLSLADGTLCHFASGATLTLDGKRLSYNCVGGSPGEQTVILGDLWTDTVWTAEKATLELKDGGFVVQRSEMVEIETVWQ